MFYYLFKINNITFNKGNVFFISILRGKVKVTKNWFVEIRQQKKKQVENVSETNYLPFRNVKTIDESLKYLKCT